MPNYPIRVHYFPSPIEKLVASCDESIFLFSYPEMKVLDMKKYPVLLCSIVWNENSIVQASGKPSGLLLVRIEENKLHEYFRLDLEESTKYHAIIKVDDDALVLYDGKPPGRFLVIDKFSKKNVKLIIDIRYSQKIWLKVMLKSDSFQGCFFYNNDHTNKLDLISYETGETVEAYEITGHGTILSFDSIINEKNEEILFIGKEEVLVVMNPKGGKILKVLKDSNKLREAIYSVLALHNSLVFIGGGYSRVEIYETRNYEILSSFELFDEPGWILDLTCIVSSKNSCRIASVVNIPAKVSGSGGMGNLRLFDVENVDIFGWKKQMKEEDEDLLERIYFLLRNSDLYVFSEECRKKLFRCINLVNMKIEIIPKIMLL